MNWVKSERDFHYQRETWNVFLNWLLILFIEYISLSNERETNLSSEGFQTTTTTNINYLEQSKRLRAKVIEIVLINSWLLLFYMYRGEWERKDKSSNLWSRNLDPLTVSMCLRFLSVASVRCRILRIFSYYGLSMLAGWSWNKKQTFGIRKVFCVWFCIPPLFSLNDRRKWESK